MLSCLNLTTRFTINNTNYLIMRSTLSKIIFLVLVSISIVSCSKEEAAIAPIDMSQANAKYTYTTDEDAVLILVNNYRASIGL